MSVSGLGHNELTLNGDRVGDHVMDPGWTKYTANGSCLFSTYDVTRMIKQGDNAFGVMLGNGMYNNVGPRYHKWTGSAGPRTLSLMLTIDGKQTLVSDETWEGRAGPISFNSVYGGEDHDARLEEPGWDSAPFPTANASAWKRAVKASGPGCTYDDLCHPRTRAPRSLTPAVSWDRLRPQLQPPVKIREHMPEPEIFQISPGLYSYDFKQEFSGWPVLAVSGSAGSVVRMTPAELDDWADSRANVSGGIPHQQFGPAYWQFTLKESGTTQLYRPKFFTCEVLTFLDLIALPSESISMFQTASGICWWRFPRAVGARLARHRRHRFRRARASFAAPASTPSAPAARSSSWTRRQRPGTTSRTA